MQAMNGSAFSLRSRSRIIGICMALALVAMAVTASGASAHKAKAPTAYVAIGDSISYGYTQQKFDENFPAEPPSAFETGPVNLLAKKLASKESKEGNALNIVNVACPGELTDGMIGTNPLLGGGPGPEYAPCGWHNVDGFERHVEYGGASQLEAAIGAVTNVSVPVKLVTINMGSNDELKSVGQCENPAYLAANGFAGGLDECLITEVGPGSHEYPGVGVFGHIIEGTGDVIGVLRAEGYTGPVGIFGFYNPQAIVLPGSDALQKGLNEAFEGYIAADAFGPGVYYANPFPVFNPQKGNAKEGAAVCKFTEFCNEFDKKFNLEKEVGHSVTAEEAAAYPIGDIHPSPAGAKKLANMMARALGII